METILNIGQWFADNAVAVLGILFVASEVLANIPERFIKANSVLGAIKDVVLGIQATAVKLLTRKP